MTAAQIQYEFVVALARELPDHSVGAVAELAATVMRLGNSHRRLALALCYGQVDQPEYERRQGRLRTRLSELLEVLGIGAVFGNDPRGPTVRLQFKSGRSNTFGSDAWSVPRS